MLPGAVDEIFTAIDSIVSVASIPLEAVKTILNTSSTFLVSLDPFDFLSVVKSLIESFRNDILSTGFFMLDMWDYPVKQLAPRSYGPGNTYSSPRLSGDTFESSFLSDLLSAFDDELDTNRPQFSGSVTAMIIVTGRGTIDDLNLLPEEDHVGYAWKNLDTSIRNAGNKIRNIRLNAQMSVIKQAAEYQPSDKVATRIFRAQRAFRLMSFMSQEDMDLIPIPMDPETGDSFFENKSPALINWEEEVVPILETVEDFYLSSEYPDWQSATLKDIYPDLVVILDTVFDPILDLFSSGGTILQSIKDLVTAIQAKLDELDRLIELITSLEAELEDFLNATGMHVLFVSTNNGITDLKSKISSALSVPFTGNNFYAGMTLLVGGPGSSVFNTLFSPIADTTEGTADP